MLHILRLTNSMRPLEECTDLSNQFNGTVTANTKITAAPKPTAVATFLETAR